MMKKIMFGIAILGFAGCAKNDTITIDGIVTMKGSAPHNYLNIRDTKSNKNYQINNADKFNLSQKQNMTLEIEANIIKKAVGAGHPATIRVIRMKDSKI